MCLPRIQILSLVVNITILVIVFLTTSIACNAYEPMKTPDPQAGVPSYISMFKCFAPGDYRYISISDEGKADYVRFDRSYKIYTYRTGSIGPEKYKELAELFESSGFNRFNDEYRFSPPEESTKIYEDVYYLITKSNANHTKSVLSHEHSLPQGMDKIIQGIEAIRDIIPDVVFQRTFLFALPGNMFECLREDTGIPVKKIDDTYGRDLYLYKAVSNPGYLVMDIDESGTKEIISRYFSNSNLIRVSLNENDYAVLLLVK